MREGRYFREQLIEQWRTLVFQWRRTRSEWNDPVALQFEREVWDELERTVPRFLDALGELNSSLERVERELDEMT
jgi:hypothetical protein